MWDYIVLGQVPGTGFQVSFETWLTGVTGLVAVYAYVRYRKRLRRLALLTWISLSIRLRQPRIRPVSA